MYLHFDTYRNVASWPSLSCCAYLYTAYSIGDVQHPELLPAEGMHRVRYLDNIMEDLDLSLETWRRTKVGGVRDSAIRRPTGKTVKCSEMHKARVQVPADRHPSCRRILPCTCLKINGLFDILLIRLQACSASPERVKTMSVSAGQIVCKLNQVRVFPGTPLGFSPHLRVCSRLGALLL